MDGIRLTLGWARGCRGWSAERDGRWGSIAATAAMHGQRGAGGWPANGPSKAQMLHREEDLHCSAAGDGAPGEVYSRSGGMVDTARLYMGRRRLWSSPAEDGWSHGVCGG